MKYVSPQIKRQQSTLRWMMLPCIIVMGVIFLYPLCKLLFTSMQYYKLIDMNNIRFVWLENYTSAFRDAHFVRALRLTLKYVLYALAIEVPLALLLMEIISTAKWGAGLIKTCFLPPMIIPSVIAGTVWRLLLNPNYGMLTWMLSALGVDASTWLIKADTALRCLVMVDIWSATPFLLIIFLAGRATIPEDLYSSAQIDGANKIESFFHISLPMMRGTLMFGLMIRLTDCIRVFPTIHVMTEGGPGTSTQTLNYYVYKTAFTYSNIGFASAMGVIMLVISVLLVVMLVGSFYIGKKERVT